MDDSNQKSAQAQDTRTALILAARDLFYSVGFNKTSIQMLIDKVGIAKGTFYHHFKSKEELLDGLIDFQFAGIYVVIGQIISRPDLNAVEKLNQVFQRSQHLKFEKIDELRLILKILYDEGNMILRYRMQQATHARIQPIIEKIVMQGIEEKRFTTPFPAEVSMLLLQVGGFLNEKAVGLLLSELDKKETLIEIARQLDMYEWMIERLLGAPQGSITIADRSGLDNLLRLT